MNLIASVEVETGLALTRIMYSAANDPSVFIITEKAPTRASSGLKAPTSAFTFHFISQDTMKTLEYRFRWSNSAADI